jgi:hypothetical protein
MNRPLRTGLQLLAALVLTGALSSCDSKPVPADVIAREYAKGLDLQAVTNLARTSKTPEELEKTLNSSSSGVNNIDLNDDKIVDYINVTEFGEKDERGFSLSTEISPGKVQEIATIVFSKEGDQANVQTTGNPSLYGNHQYYRSSFGLTDVLLWSYLFSNHSAYRSPYGYNNYPGSYGGGWSRRSDMEYGTRNSRYRGMSPAMGAGTGSMNTTVKSPNADKQAARARIISNPKQSQRSFAQRTGGTRSSGGFGRSSSSSSSRSSFGGGK